MALILCNIYCIFDQINSALVHKKGQTSLDTSYREVHLVGRLCCDVPAYVIEKLSHWSVCECPTAPSQRIHS